MRSRRSRRHGVWRGHLARAEAHLPLPPLGRRGPRPGAGGAPRMNPQIRVLAVGRARVPAVAQRPRLDEGLSAGRAGAAPAAESTAAAPGRRIRRTACPRNCRRSPGKPNAARPRRPRRPCPDRCRRLRRRPARSASAPTSSISTASLAGGELIRADMPAVPAAQGRPDDAGAALQHGLEGHAVPCSSPG